MPLSERQMRVVQHARGDRGYVLQLVGGATRSGKTYSCMRAFAWYVVVSTSLRPSEVVDFALIGQTIETIWRNTGAAMLELLRRMGCSAKRMGGTSSSHILVRTPAGGRGRVWFFGTGLNERGREESMRGASFAGFLADECTQMSDDFWQMLQSRLDRAHVRGWATYNPAHPGHWFKREVLDKPGQWNAEVVEFGLDDNPVLDEVTKARYRKQFVGAFGARMLEGEWRALRGLVWPFWTKAEGDLRTLWVTQQERRRHGWGPKLIGRLWGLDYGQATTMAALGARPARVARVPDKRKLRHVTTWVVDRQYYHDSRKRGSRTDAQHLEYLRSLIPLHARVIIDPTMPRSFRVELSRYWRVIDGFNQSVVEGLQRTSALLANGLLVLDQDKVPSLIDEIGTYRWSETGEEDKPFKQFDHACDALRYLACALEPYTQVDVGGWVEFAKGLPRQREPTVWRPMLPAGLEFPNGEKES